MKIWFPTIRAGSGVDVYVNRLAEALKKQDIETVVTWYDKRYEFAPSLLKKASPPSGTDIVHANSWNAFAFKRNDIPLLVTEHHCVLDPAYRPYKSLLQQVYHEQLIRRYERASLAVADRIIAVSHYTAGSLQRVFNTPGITVIHNWVDTETFTIAGNARQDGPFRLLFVGNRSRRKGWDLIPAIMAALGDGYQLATTAGLRNRNTGRRHGNIVQLGRLGARELVQAYQRSDALLFPSRFEGFGYAALEAMACGKPVIAANNSALPELVIPGVSGLLCDPDDIDCYISACRQLGNDPALAQELGDNARHMALDAFTEDRQVRRYIDVYDDILAA
jgi:glycosyltransferase involved in cell wall biosynthesis